MSLEGQHIGHFRLVKVLGSGGMGEVYLAEDTPIQRRVAIKVIQAEVNPYPNASTFQETNRLFQRIWIQALRRHSCIYPVLKLVDLLVLPLTVARHRTF
jgi:serine/threonine protein kinase